ncbi:MAG: glutamate-5-semialdehyde dehydrogenase [Chthoniobacterales bacterium]
MSNLTTQIHDIGAKAREASRALARLSRQDKDLALTAMADELESNPGKILEANARDIALAEKAGLSAAMIDRLRLNADRLKSMAKGIREVVGLTDPVSEVIREWTRPNGLRITKIRTPIGVIGIIYESRPNVTADAAVLCIKTGNATILRGGSESFHSNLAIAEALQQGGAKVGLPENSVQLIPVTDREAVKIMAQMDAFIDVIVPRGGHALIEAVVSSARMPVIKHFHGVCIIYVDKEADFEMAEQIVINAKCQRPGVCNAMETLLVHEAVAPEFLKKLAGALEAQKVELRGDEASRKILGNGVKAATEEDWTTEYLDLIMAVRIVPDLDAAVNHINKYGSHHSDAIVTRDAQAAENFLNEVDSATVYWNASTRFTDGAEFGFGAEIGISTDKLHARGPMALEELTTYKYTIRGEGQIR